MKISTVWNTVTRGKSAPTIEVLPDPPSKICVCVIGVGYVGESLLRLFGNVTETLGYDISNDRIASLKHKFVDNDRIQLTSESADLAKGTHFLIAVPTPVKDDHSVNLEDVRSAIKVVALHAKLGSCIVIESSIPVGTTRALLAPYKLIHSCGMSPERIDPGRLLPTAEDIPKVVAGLTPKALKQIVALYGMVYRTLVPVSKPEVAEMTKLYENCYRMVNIAYVNEISDACLAHGINPQEMINAAATKPFGFQPFYPGLGVGGHCLPVNPWYLLQNSKRLRVLELSTKLMMDRPRIQAKRFYVQCQKYHNISKDTPSRKPRILIVGLGFKTGQSNVASSPALSFAQVLKELGCSKVAYYDPTVNSELVPFLEKLSEQDWSADYVEGNFDGVVVCNALDVIDTKILDQLQGVFVKRFV